MDIPPWMSWWLLAGLAVAAEMTTGTFYLLMIALGLGAGGVAAITGLPLQAQIVFAAVVAAVATGSWHWIRMRSPRSAPVASNRDVNLDVGERVRVEAWGSDGTARVQYRGTQWTARLAPGASATPGEHVVAAVEGNWLVLAPAAASQS